MNQTANVGKPDPEVRELWKKLFPEMARYFGYPALGKRGNETTSPEGQGVPKGTNNEQD